MATPPTAAVLLTVEEAACRLNIGRTTMYSLVSAGVIESVTIGRLRRVPTECLDNFVAVLRSSQPETAEPDDTGHRESDGEVVPFPRHPDGPAESADAA